MIPKNQHQSKASTEKLIASSSVKTPLSNTGLKPVDTVDYNVKYFFDYVKYFGERLNINLHHVEFLIQQLLAGELFRVKECYPLQLEGLSVSRKDCFLETRPASGKQWSYVWQNALGLKLFVRECPRSNYL